MLHPLLVRLALPQEITVLKIDPNDAIMHSQQTFQKSTSKYGMLRTYGGINCMLLFSQSFLAVCLIHVLQVSETVSFGFTAKGLDNIAFLQHHVNHE